MAHITLSTLLSSLLLAGVTAQANAALNPKTVAVINGQELSLSEFNRRYNENIKYFKFTPPTKTNVLDDIIKFELGVTEARKRGLHKDPKIIERMNTVLYQALVEDALSNKFKKIKVRDKDVQNFCKSYPEVRTSHVYVPLRMNPLKSEEKKARETIKKALVDLKSGKDFEAVVAEYSDGYATTSGGDIGYQMKDKLDPSYYSAALKLKNGAYTTAAVRSQFGLHIIKLSGKRSCSEINVAEWKRMIYDEKRAKVFNRFLGKLRKQAKVEINYKAIQ